MIKNTNNITKFLIVIALVATAIAWRIFNHDFQLVPNLEIVTAVSVIAALLIGWRAALAVPISTMIISDLFIGNSSIFIFTWGAFAVIGLGALLLRKLNDKPKSQVAFSLGFAVISSFFFFTITNFGVWLQGWYGPTFAGLVECFTLAIPFYRTMLIGNIIIVPIAVAAYQLIRIKSAQKDLVINSTISQ